MAILLAALTPVPYKVFTIAAGWFGLALTPFVLASMIGRGARFFALGILILFFGDHVKGFIDRYFNLVCILFFVLLVAGFLVVKWVLQ